MMPINNALPEVFRKAPSPPRTWAPIALYPPGSPHPVGSTILPKPFGSVQGSRSWVSGQGVQHAGS